MPFTLPLALGSGGFGATGAATTAAFPWLAAGAAGLGALGTIFGSGDDETERLLRERLKGIDPKILEEMRRRARGAIGNQATAERVSTQQRLGRQDAPVAKQEEVADKIRTRQFGAIGSALADIDMMNEQTKRGALSDLAAFSERKNADRGQGYASLFGAGFSGLMQANQMEELEKLFGGGSAQFQRRTFGDFGGSEYARLNRSNLNPWG